MKSEGRAVPVIPPKDPNDEPCQATLRVTQGILAEVDLIRLEEDRSRNEVAAYLLRWALDAHWREKGRPRPPDAIGELATALSAKKRKR